MTAARKRLEGTALNSWNDVDDNLCQIGVIDRELALIESAANEEIDKVKAALKTSTAPLLERKTGLELAIKDYCEANRADFVKVKTKALTFGEVGFRQSTKIIIKRIANTIQALKDMGFPGCVRSKEEPDKEAMKALTDEQLAEVGATRRTENVFGYTVNVEKIKEAA